MSDFIEVEQLPSSSELKAEDKVLINQNDDDTIVSLGELKEYCRPELATTTESGLVSTGEQSFSGKKTFTEVTTNKATVSNATIQNGNITEATVENLRITGSLIQDGETVETEVETLKVQDQVIVTRSGATVGMGAGEYTGIKAEKYDGVNDGVLAFGPDGVARVGDEGSTQPLATREEAPTNNSLQIWDEQTQSLKSFPMGNKGQYLKQGENGLEYGSAVAVDGVQDYVDEQIQAEATLRQNALEEKANKDLSNIVNIKKAQFNLLKDIEESTDTITDDSLIMSAYLNPSETSGSVFKKKVSYLWSYIKDKINEVLGINETTISNLLPFKSTSMWEMGFTPGKTVSVNDFWVSLLNNFKKHQGCINFSWNGGYSAYVTDGVETIEINGGCLLFTTDGHSMSGQWRRFRGIYTNGIDMYTIFGEVTTEPGNVTAKITKK